ncbi:MAG: OmpH family outer membrane protein [Bacteroidales bacterium]|nr:OmpH family outer membrane protein [Bacteroidales bacterium]
MKKFILISIVALFASNALMAQEAATPKFAYVNFSELVQLMPEMDEARATSEAASNEAQETYRAMVEEFQKKYEQYSQKSATWTAAIKESKEKELADLEGRIREFQEAIQQELQEQQQKLMAPIYKKAQEVVAKLGVEKGYTMVFDVTTILYINPAQCDDLTAEARVVLNIPAERTMESLQAELQAKAAAAQQAAQ